MLIISLWGGGGEIRNLQMGEGDDLPPKMEVSEELDAPTKKTARQLDFAGGSVEVNQAHATSISATVATPTQHLQPQGPIRLP